MRLKVRVGTNEERGQSTDRWLRDNNRKTLNPAQMRFGGRDSE